VADRLAAELVLPGELQLGGQFVSALSPVPAQLLPELIRQQLIFRRHAPTSRRFFSFIIPKINGDLPKIKVDIFADFGNFINVRFRCIRASSIHSELFP
jgi:hypothetical protein